MVEQDEEQELTSDEEQPTPDRALGRLRVVLQVLLVVGLVSALAAGANATYLLIAIRGNAPSTFTPGALRSVYELGGFLVGGWVFSLLLGAPLALVYFWKSLTPLANDRSDVRRIWVLAAWVIPIIGATKSVKIVRSAGGDRLAMRAMVAWWIAAAAFFVSASTLTAWIGLTIEELRYAARGDMITSVFAALMAASFYLVVTRTNPDIRTWPGHRRLRPIQARLAVVGATLACVGFSVGLGHRIADLPPPDDLAFEQLQADMRKIGEAQADLSPVDVLPSFTVAQVMCFEEQFGPSRATAEDPNDLIGLLDASEADLRRGARAVDACIGARHYQPDVFDFMAKSQGPVVSVEEFDRCADETYVGDVYGDFMVSVRPQAEEYNANLATLCFDLSARPADEILPAALDSLPLSHPEHTYEVVNDAAVPLIENRGTGTRIAVGVSLYGQTMAVGAGIAPENLPLRVDHIDVATMGAAVRAAVPDLTDSEIAVLLEPITGGPATTVAAGYKGCLTGNGGGELEQFWVVRSVLLCEYLP